MRAEEGASTNFSLLGSPVQLNARKSLIRIAHVRALDNTRWRTSASCSKEKSRAYIGISFYIYIFFTKKNRESGLSEAGYKRALYIVERRNKPQ